MLIQQSTRTPPLVGEFTFHGISKLNGETVNAHGRVLDDGRIALDTGKTAAHYCPLILAKGFDEPEFLVPPNLTEYQINEAQAAVAQVLQGLAVLSNVATVGSEVWAMTTLRDELAERLKAAQC